MNPNDILKDLNITLPVDLLVVAIVQEQDADITAVELEKYNISVFRLPSAGGFLGQRSVTLLIGVNKGQEKDLFHVIHQTCRPRVEYVTLPIEGSPIPMPSPTPVTVGGATLFSFEVERYEVF